MSRHVDAHHHVWTLARGDYGWLTPALAPIYRDFSLADLAPRLAASGVVNTVLAQAAPTAVETRFLLDVAHRSDGVVQGVVGWVDLAASDAIATLHTLSGDPLMKSVRPMLQDIADANWILRPDVQPALAALPELDLRFDALVKPPQLPALLTTLGRYPDLDVVIDHGAKPEIATRRIEPWRSLIREASTHPRVHCKLSGLATEAAGTWSVDDLRPYVDHLLDCFGPGRLMWGSDWPVVELGGGYARWRAATEELLAPLGAPERDAILGGTARRFYALTTDSTS
jgi:L-fuconolactonase